MENEFVHLHLHTQYSLLDGAIHIGKLIPRAQELGMKSVAITDHGVMYGVIDFYKSCKKAGIKPIIGCEFYISPASRHDREYERDQTSNYHLILLAKNNQGFYNLRKLATLAQLEGFYRRPRIDKEALKEYHEGIIALSACLAGEIPRKIMNSTYQTARDTALEYLDIMGEGNFYLEVQQNGIPEQTIVNNQIKQISKETGIPMVATCDCHFLHKKDQPSHDVLMCIQTGKLLSDPNRMEILTDELYFKSTDEMKEAFADFPDAIENTVKIADQCNVDITFGELHLPSYDYPEGFNSPAEYFRHIARTGLQKRLQDVPEERHEEYRKRLEMEIEVIELKGYVGYFLIVWDFINYSRENDIPVGPGRGSGAGSLVAYSMTITNIDPIKLNLLFERFLNPERPSLPDFDIDFCVKKRDRVIQYVRNKYGHDKVCQIITFGRLSGRMIIRDVCRVLEIPLSDVAVLAKSIPEVPGMTLSKALEIDPGVKEAFDKHPRGDEILEHAQNLEGLLRHAGMHAAGVIIADKPLSEYVPLCRGKGKGGDDGDIEILAQYEKDLLEEIGLVKFDFLGLANLTIIDDTVKRIQRESKPDFDISKIPFDDKEVYQMLSNGDSTGVFQLESSGMRQLMRKLQPSTLEDIIALNALFRPGPIGSGMLDTFCNRKHGIEPIEYPLPELANVLQETYGIIVYQEQVMEIARLIAGYSLGSADILRRAMGKKKKEEMDRQKHIFLEGSEELNIPGARKLGFNLKAAEEIFSLMEKFAEYGFNKSHSAAYAVVAYQTAFLRKHYPAQFLAAAMSAEESKLEDIIPYIDDARGMGIEVYPPNINISGALFEHIDSAIWFGLKSIKNVGAAAVDNIIEERNANGAYKSIYDFCDRVDLRTVNKKTLEALIHAGAFDCFGKNRNQHMQVLEACVEQSAKKQKMHEKGLMSIEDFLFTEEEKVETQEYYPDVPEMPDSELLAAEKAVLSFYFSSHPVKNAMAISNNAFSTTEDVANSENNSKVQVLGLIKSFRKLLTNKNNPDKKQENMASFVLEDLSGSIEAVIFPRSYAAHAHLIEPEKLVVLEGTWVIKEDRASIQVDKVYPFEEALECHTKGLEIIVNIGSLTHERSDKLFQIINENRGQMPVIISFNRGDGLQLQLRTKHSIKPSEECFIQMKELLGANSYHVISDKIKKDTDLFKLDKLYIEDPDTDLETKELEGEGTYEREYDRSEAYI